FSHGLPPYLAYLFFVCRNNTQHFFDDVPLEPLAFKTILGEPAVEGSLVVWRSRHGSKEDQLVRVGGLQPGQTLLGFGGEPDLDGLGERILDEVDHDRPPRVYKSGRGA